MWLLIPLLPPSSGRRWRVAPEVGFALFRLRPTPALRASPFHGKGVDGLLIPFLPPSSGRRWRVAPEVGFALFRLRPTPCPSTTFHGKVVDGLLIPLLPPSFGRRWRAAPEVGFALFRLRPTPCPSGIPLPSEGRMDYSSRFSLLPLEGGGAQRRRLASLSFAFGQPLALRATPCPSGIPLPWEGGRWITHP